MGVVKRHRAAFLLLTAGLLAVVTLIEAYVLYGANLFNDAIERRDWVAAARHSVGQARIAEAFVLESNGDWQSALELYAELEQRGAEPLSQIARFNMANLYLRRGMEMAGDGSMDVALPLIELAKTTYRAVLRADPGNWDARFNLATALQVVPDVEAEELEEDIMPERSQRSLVPLDARRELP